MSVEPRLSPGSCVASKKRVTTDTAASSESVYPPKRKKSYVEKLCFVCEDSGNPKKMFVLTRKSEELKRMFLQMRIENGKGGRDIACDSVICQKCSDRTIETKQSCFVCIKLFVDKVMCAIEGDRFKEVAVEHRKALLRDETVNQGIADGECV